ncbi:bifunctional diguanylate cyclase/phosphodiesterase [Alishewanella sp. SMS8]|uniref:putative bifunctional diguanylate cyclase/phosphodiesterase n=1 Tax=Alishewanella sp. SMS8 TaxID=2994676 RepID=UPI002742734C|nr:EAL domain-containing protein [Alishewanella sp. SMS8]MDP4945718.1 EAL domain-containing protein [Alishewanella sp.]MDP5187764.1 EAL domain-containing protein [Alishewanella sp.]MDP5458055.1 EAL domain-containing protein [Alishewanella sp. SMS8]
MPVQQIVFFQDGEKSDWNNIRKIISHALKNQHFSMVYQPLISVNTGKIIGFESLVRCQSPKFGVISPADFIPCAEQSGQILELGNWIFQKALLDLKCMLNHGLSDICLSLNVSPVQLLNSDIFEQIMSLLHTFSIPPSAIKLELTETALINNPQKIANIFNAFKREGVQIWLDDFGTGFASLSLLRQFNIDGLKIDRSFVDGIDNNNDDFTLCSAVIAMAQRLGLFIIAEGVETENQLQILSQLGCDVVQGYLLGKPNTLGYNLEQWAL